MSIALASINLRRGSAGRNEVEWSRTSSAPARRTAPRDIENLTINMSLLAECGVQTDSRRYLTIEFFNKVQRTLRKHRENRNHVALSTNGETICQPPKLFNTPMAA